MHPDYVNFMAKFRYILSDLMCILTEYFKDVHELEEEFDEIMETFDDIMEGCYGNKTYNKKSVAMHIAAYGGFWVGAFKPAIVGDLLNSDQLVVYKGMIFTRDIWE
jgi:hypothetical protein